MALIFPEPDDVMKSRVLQEYFGISFLEKVEPHKRYDFLRQWFKRNSTTIEEKLVELAGEWTDAIDDKSKRKINLQAFKLIRGCCKIKGKYLGDGKEYYRTYRNLRRIYSGEISFYVG